MEPLVLAMAAIVSPGLLSFKLVTGKGVALYSPQRVLIQFGYDQDAFSITGGDGSHSARDAEARFIGRGLGMILKGYHR